MKRILLLTALLAATVTAAAKVYNVTSPDGNLSIKVETTENALLWSASLDGKVCLEPSEISLETPSGTFGAALKVRKARTARTDASFSTPFYRKSSVRDRHSSLKLECRGNFDIEFRAYDDAAAYRIIAKGPATIKNEKAEFRFADDFPVLVPYVNDNRSGERYCYAFESYYDSTPLSGMYADSLAINPLAVCLPEGRKAVIMDAGVENYPGMFLKKGEGNSLVSEFAPLPLESIIDGHSRLNLIPVRRADHIAVLEKAAPLPWRAVVLTRDDAQLPDCDLAQALAPECRVEDAAEWIRPGKVSWDWWNNFDLTGVDFKAGMNTPTYKYYIDFASKYGLEYIILDEGWSTEQSLRDVSGKVDLKELVDYGASRGVGLILWSSWRNMIKNTDADMAWYAGMGIKGFKVDFFDRDDQEVCASTYAIAECAARHHLLLDYHGLRPSGIQRAYPNIVNFEGVKGLENSKWEPRTASGPLNDQPLYDVQIPFLRMLCGPLDYTPGAMVNATKENFFGSYNHPMSQGTRVHQMAMYTIFDAPLQMLCDSPSKYLANPECTGFLAAVPTTFDETVVLDAELGEYLVTARRKGDKWFIAAMNNWTPRDLKIDTGPLEGFGGKALIFSDGVNADRQAMDYSREEVQLESGAVLNVHLAPAGGWTAIVE